MLGVPEERYDDFQRWSHDIVTQPVVRARGRGEPRDPAPGRHRDQRLPAEEIERHRRERPDDLLTTMLDMEGSDAMSSEEIRSTAVLLLAAGYDTTAKTMSNSLIALERNPDQRRLVAQGPVAGTRRHRGEPALVRPRPVAAPARHHRHGSGRHGRGGRRDRLRVQRGGQPGSGGGGSTPSVSTSGGKRSRTWPSVTDRTCAWGRRWPGSRRRSRWRSCSGWLPSIACGISTSASRCSSGVRSVASWTWGSGPRCDTISEQSLIKSKEPGVMTTDQAERAGFV